MKRVGLFGLIATALIALIALSGTAHAFLYTGYHNTYNRNAYNYNTYHRQYDVQPRLPYFNADENRPEGYGLTRQTTPYPVPTRSCPNHYTLGHRSSFDGRTAWYDAVNARQRVHPRYRSQSNHCPPRYRLNPNTYYGR